MIYPITLGLLLITATGMFLWLDRRAPRPLPGNDLPLGKVQAKTPLPLRSNVDPATRLLAREVVVARFQGLLSQARRDGTTFGAILVGLDDFEQLANQLGTDSGNRLLATLGRRLVAATRETDTVGFLRGHDFAVLIPNLQSAGALDAMVSKLRAAIEMPFDLRGVAQAVSPTVHFGKVLCPQDGEDWASVLKAADHRLRRNRVCPEGTDRGDAVKAPVGIREPLATLGLSWPVTPQAVKSRYKALAKRDHPDANGGSRDAEEHLKTVNLAYAAIRAVLEPGYSGRYSTRVA